MGAQKIDFFEDTLTMYKAIYQKHSDPWILGTTLYLFAQPLVSIKLFNVSVYSVPLICLQFLQIHRFLNKDRRFPLFFSRINFLYCCILLYGAFLNIYGFGYSVFLDNIAYFSPMVILIASIFLGTWFVCNSNTTAFYFSNQIKK